MVGPGMQAQQVQRHDGATPIFFLKLYYNTANYFTIANHNDLTSLNAVVLPDRELFLASFFLTQTNIHYYSRLI
jgi:hypothetical protein